MTPDMMTDNLARAQDTIARLTKDIEHWRHEVGKRQSQVDRLTAERDYDRRQSEHKSTVIDKLNAANQRAAASVEAVVTAQEAAKVLLDAWERGEVQPGPILLDAGFTDHQSDVVSRGMEIALRAIAGGRNE